MQDGEVVGEAEEGGLGGFGGGGTGPRFLFVEFVFEGVAGFFNVLAAAVEQDDEAGFQGHFVRKILP